jgi:hypothetical protein
MRRLSRAVTQASRAAGSETGVMFLARLAKWLKGNRVVTITGKVPFAACRARREAPGALSGPGP